MEELVFGRRYRVTEKIGTGGMADVYKAVDDVLGRTVAVKVMHARYAADPAFAARFRQEAQAAASLSHPNVVHVYDYGEDASGPYIVMELVDGQDLTDILRRSGALPPRQAARIAAGVAPGLTLLAPADDLAFPPGIYRIGLDGADGRKTFTICIGDVPPGG